MEDNTLKLLPWGWSIIKRHDDQTFCISKSASDNVFPLTETELIEYLQNYWTDRASKSLESLRHSEKTLGVDFIEKEFNESLDDIRRCLPEGWSLRSRRYEPPAKVELICEKREMFLGSPASALEYLKGCQVKDENSQAP